MKNYQKKKQKKKLLLDEKVVEFCVHQNKETENVTFDHLLVGRFFQ